MVERVLVVAAHPDDEVLGCGGSIHRHAKSGDAVKIIVAAEGATSRPDHGPDSVDRLRMSATQASSCMGVEPPLFLGLPDNRLDSIALLDIVRLIEEVARAFLPTIVYIHHPSDCNMDHTIIHRAGLAAFRPLPGGTVKALRLYEVLSSSEWGSRTAPAFRAHCYIPLTLADIQAKCDALSAYADEMRLFPHPRSTEAIKALASLRGAQCGHAWAEAFTVEYELV